jgi:hypothetical protein
MMKIFRYVAIASLISIFTSCGIGRVDIYTLATGIPHLTIVPLDNGAYFFGLVDLYTSRTQNFTIENKGYRTLEIKRIYKSDEDDMHFIIDTTDTSSIVEPHESTSFTVTFKPTSTGAQAIDLIIESNDPGKSTFRYTIYGQASGIATSAPDINIKQGSVDIPNGSGIYYFGSVEALITTSVEFTIENLGEADLYIGNIYFNSGDIAQFSIISPSIPYSLAPSETTNFTVKFTPTEPITYEAVIKIVSDDPDELPYTITVQGTGASADPLFQDINVKNELTGNVISSGSLGYDFTSVGVGTAVPVTFTIENAGSAALTISVPVVSSGDFFDYSIDTSSLSTTIFPGGNTSFEVIFSPQSTGSKTITVQIDNDDPDPIENPYTFSITGRGSANDTPDISILIGASEYPSGSYYYFNAGEEVIVGNTSSAVFTLKNNGTAELIVKSILLVGGQAKDFTHNLVVPVVIQSGDKIDFTVSFSPGKSGERLTRMQLTSNDSDENTYKINIIGFGID